MSNQPANTFGSHDRLESAIALAPSLLVALTTMFGLQMLRLLITGLAVYLRQIKEVDVALLGLIGLAIFLAGFLAPIVVRLIPRQTALVLTAASLGLVRLVEQFISSAPVDLSLAIAGTVLFLWFVPVIVSEFRDEDAGRPGLLGIGILLGISGDTAVKGVFYTVDLSWVQWPSGDIVIMILTLAQWGLLWRMFARDTGGTDDSAPFQPGLFLAIGPLLVIELMLFQNIGQQTVLTGWSQPAVYALILVANLAGAAAGLASTVVDRAVSRPAVAAAGVLLILVTVIEPSGNIAAVSLLAGQVIASVAFVTTTIRADQSSGGAENAGSAAWFSLGMLLFLILIFAYYASYDVNLPIPGGAILPIAAGITTLTLLRRRFANELMPVTARIRWAAMAPAALLLLLPAVQFLTWADPKPSAGAGLPVRVMSYNLHQGFDVDGILGLEALARVIEKQNPSIVALQEVSRGWVIDGSVDMLVWMSQRLEMPYAWGPAGDSVWGNAVLSRLPIVDSSNHLMPNNDELLLNRAFLAVTVDLGGGETLDVIATHLHAGNDDSDLRVPQVEAISEHWSGGANTVLMGDFNAHAEHPEMVSLFDSGFVDAFVASGSSGAGFTSESDTPWHRIDYILTSPDLNAREFEISESLASDHFAVSATLYR